MKRKVLKLKFGRRKFGNIPVSALGGIYFKSKRERDHALWLESERQAGRVTKWVYEKGYDLIVNGKLICMHLPDFTVWFPNGKTEIHEVKCSATMTRDWSIKRKLFEVLYPELEYLVIT